MDSSYPQNLKVPCRRMFYVDFRLHDETFLNVFPDLDSAAQFSSRLSNVDGLVFWRLLDVSEIEVDSYECEPFILSKPYWVHETGSIYENKKENEK